MYRLIRGVTLAMEGLVRRSDLRPGLHFLLADLEDLATGGGDQLWGLPGALQGRCCHCRRCPRGPAQAEGALWGRGSSHARWRGWGRCMGGGSRGSGLQRQAGLGAPTFSLCDVPVSSPL